MLRLGRSICKGSASARSANFPLFWADDGQSFNPLIIRWQRQGNAKHGCIVGSA